MSGIPPMSGMPPKSGMPPNELPAPPVWIATPAPKTRTPAPPSSFGQAGSLGAWPMRAVSSKISPHSAQR